MTVERVEFEYRVLISVPVEHGIVAEGPSELEIKRAIYRGVDIVDSEDAVDVEVVLS